ncbi:GHKL domain-containing protein [Facklamia sp. DSM 111018]|uniref:histidine kinase n=1 Tax=Facklamia lactis TaxID=2749967 RepID=A0ABS0LRW2_9LACT|nr:ATP-binding protein [Facklamia lactis]MBG9986900.1 GHKL domain-containing protein [Facklamia lactis]
MIRNTEKFKRFLLCSVIIALSAQIHITYRVEGFILALSVAILPIILFFNEDLHPIYLSLSIAIASPFFRGLLLYITDGYHGYQIIEFIITDMVFYMTYGIIYYLFYWHRRQVNLTTFACTIIMCDYLSNLLEVSLLMGFQGYQLTLFRDLFIAALARGGIGCICAFIYYSLNILVDKEAHERRYHYFLWSSSAIKSEVYFMQKNINEIERIMKNAYQLNNSLNQNEQMEAEAQIALSVAKDVHEIKKAYKSVISGLNNFFDSKDHQQMSLSEILKIVLSYGKLMVRNKGYDILIIIDCEIDVTVTKHYYLVTILSNLVSNSIDAIDKTSNGQIHIRVVKEDSKYLVLDLIDNGPGIPEKFHEIIFEPGFSTKFDEETGDIFRGIGLSHVKTILNEQFNGDIQMNKNYDEGASFRLMIDQDCL